MAKMIHSMIRVADAARSLEFYRQAFGLTLADRYDFDDFSLLYLRDAEGSFELELTVNAGRDSYTPGDGYGHLAVSVADIEAEHALCAKAGLSPTPVKTLEHDGKALGRFFFLTDPDGYKIEVLQRGGRFL